MSSSASLGAQLPPLAPAESESVKRCWICYEDSTEDDTTDPPRWRSPCPCSLVAHERCLLEWIADKELTRGSMAESNKKLQCPQCDAEIKLYRPTSHFLTWMRRGDRIFSQLALPACAAALVGSVMLGAYHHGLWSVRILFGERDAAYILRDLQRHHGWRLTYAFIPAALVFSRTESDIAVPLFELFVAFRHFPHYMTMNRVPPAVNSLVYLSLFRHVYNYTHSLVARKLQQQWMADIRQQNEPPHEVEEGQGLQDEVIEVNIEIGLGEAAEDGPAEGQAENDNPANPPPAQQANDGADPAQNGVPAEENPLPRMGNNLIIGGASILRTMVGALVFPAIASGMGALIRLSLPTSLTRPTSHLIFLGRANPLSRGILQTQWGQSLLGACLFVGLKDAAILFTQWRMARNFRDRRVLDWVGTRGREADGQYILRN